MSWADKIREYFEQKGFGLYLIELRDHCYFKPERDKIVTGTDNIEATNPLTERTIPGTYRRAGDIAGNNLSLEIFRDFEVIIPYARIKHVEKLRDSLYSLPKGLEDEIIDGIMGEE